MELNFRNDRMFKNKLNLFIYSALVVLSLLLMFNLKSVLAETIGSRAVSDGLELSKGGTNDRDPNSVSGSSTSISSIAVSIATLLDPASIATNEDGTKSELYYEMPQYLRQGLVGFASSTTYNAFLYGPSMNIPHFYASNFLPKELGYSNLNNTYAAVGSPPSSQSAFTLLDDIGINKLWMLSTGIAVMGFVIVLIVAGFMVMFRSKLGGQAVVTVTMALRNMVIGLILTVFSYAFGAFFLNLSKFLIVVVAGIFATLMNKDPVFINDPLNLIFGAGVSLVFGKSPSIPDKFRLILEGIANGFLSSGAGLGSSLGVVGGSIFNVISTICIGIALVIASFKIFLKLITVYAKMLIDIIAAPIIFMMGSIPGKQDAIKSWFNRMFSNSLIPVFIFIIVNLSIYIVETVSLSSTRTDAMSSFTGGAITHNHGVFNIAGQSMDAFIKTAGVQKIIAMILYGMASEVDKIVAEMFGIKESAIGKVMGASAMALTPEGVAQPYLKNVDDKSKSFQSGAAAYLQAPGLIKRIANSRAGGAVSGIVQTIGKIPIIGRATGMDKLGSFAEGWSKASAPWYASRGSDAYRALVDLGYSPSQINQIGAFVKDNVPLPPDFAPLYRAQIQSSWGFSDSQMNNPRVLEIISQYSRAMHTYAARANRITARGGTPPSPPPVPNNPFANQQNQASPAPGASAQQGQGGGVQPTNP